MPFHGETAQHCFKDVQLHTSDDPIGEDLASNFQGGELYISPVIREPSNLLIQDFDVTDPSIWSNMTFLDDWDFFEGANGLLEALYTMMPPCQHQ